MMMVAATCSEQYTSNPVLFEPPDTGLPAGLLASLALVRVNHGTSYIPVVNVSTSDALLYPCTNLGTVSCVQVISVPARVTEVNSMTVSLVSQAVNDPVQDQIGAIDLSALSDEEQGQVRALLQRYHVVFSSHNSDLGWTSLTSHQIPLVDNMPARQQYRRIPPSEYEVVKAHINQLLEVQVIWESSSPFASPIVLVRKKIGSLCMCVDYHQLNART